MKTRKNKRRYNRKAGGGIFSVKSQSVIPSDSAVTYKELADGVYKNILYPIIFSDLGTNIVSVQTAKGIFNNINTIVSLIIEIVYIILPSANTSEEEYLNQVIALLKKTYGDNILLRLNIREPGQMDGGFWGNTPTETAPLSIKEVVNKFNYKWTDFLSIITTYAHVTQLPQTVSRANAFLCIRQYIGNPTDYNTLELIVKYFLGDDIVKRINITQ